ncbi:MAG TPA: hypothetical protein DCM28_08590 [Phycisphaerales bacterium]|nr:hypothetical protein [Phycisphaerales bacterium]HCD34955.1 hypothetical protein [Phycisphaerales bacterium]
MDEQAKLNSGRLSLSRGLGGHLLAKGKYNASQDSIAIQKTTANKGQNDHVTQTGYCLPTSKLRCIFPLKRKHLITFSNRESVMKSLSALLLLVILLSPSQLLADENAEHRHHTKAQLKTEPKTFEGTWSGMWDLCWKVEFQIKHVEGDQFEVVYRWQENTESNEMEQNTIKGKLKNGVLKLGSISIEFKDEHRLLAIGRFRQFTRVAFLNFGPVTFDDEHKDDDKH